MPFVKLDCDVLDSTLWSDDLALKVFLAALCMAKPVEFTEPLTGFEVDSLEPNGFVAKPDWYGFVRAAGQAIVDRAKLKCTPEEAAEALKRLCLPDPKSRSVTHQGRRLCRVDGGYIVINYMKFRDFDYTARDRMAALRKRQKKLKEANATVTPKKRNVRRNVTDTESREQRAEAESITTPVETTMVDGSPVEAPAAPAPPTPPEPPKAPAWSNDAAELWKTRFQGTVPGGKIGHALKPLVEQHGWPLVRQGWAEYLESAEAQYASPQRFADTFGDWLRRRVGTPAQQPAAQPGPTPEQLLGGSQDAEPAAVELWTQIADRLTKQIAVHNYSTWIRPIRALRIEQGEKGKVLVLAVPAVAWTQQLRDTGYAQRMRIAAEELGHAGMLFRAIVVRSDPGPEHNGSVT